jgi:hypothetical protein
MKHRLRFKNRTSVKLKNKLRNTAVVFTFASLLFGIFMLYQFIGNVANSRAQQLEEKIHPQKSELEGFIGRKKISINPEKIKGNSLITNLPILVNIRFDELRQNEYGGTVFSKVGKDFVFTAADGYTKIPFEIERYDPTTGKLLAWVRPDSLLPGSFTHEMFLYYGNNENVDAQSRFTFTSPFAAVWHFNGNFSTSSSLNIAGEIKGIKDEEGRFAGGKEFLAYDATYASFESNEMLDFNGNLTVSAWIKTNESADNQYVFTNAHKKGGCNLFIDKEGKLVFETVNENGKISSVENIKSNITISHNQWYNIAGTYNESEGKIVTYINGQKDREISVNKAYSKGSNVVIGAVSEKCHGFFNGIIDEVRIANASFSSDYIATAYASESDPETFIKADEQEVFTASKNITQINVFEARVSESHVSINWQTSKESNLDYFTLERSSDRLKFEKVATKFAIGNSEKNQNYFLIDNSPAVGNAFYRLRYTSFKGESDVSNVISVFSEGLHANLGISKVEPNPFKDNFSVVFKSDNEASVKVKLTSISGQLMHSEVYSPKIGIDNFYEYKDASTLQPGIYFLSLSQANENKTIKLIKRM